MSPISTSTRSVCQLFPHEPAVTNFTGVSGQPGSHSQLITNLPAAPDENSRYASGASSIVERDVITEASGTLLSAVNRAASASPNLENVHEPSNVRCLWIMWGVGSKVT